MKNLFYLLFIGLFSNVYSNDVIFMVDSSKSIFGSESCEYSHLIQNFTSDFVNELSSCNNINYSSVQYNIKGYIDFSFISNNSDVYDKMKNYDFRYGAPTLIHTGLEKVSELYSDKHSDHSTYLVLLTDGETLNKVDFQNALSYYPFNSTQFNIILIKIGTHVMENNIVLDVFNNSDINYLTCSINPLEHILNNTNIVLTSTATTTTTTATATATTTTTTATTTNTNATTTATTTNTVTATATATATATTTNATTATNATTTISNNTNSSMNITSITPTTTYTNLSNKNSTISCGNNSNPNSNSHVINSSYKILIIVTAGIIFLFSIAACFSICYYKTNHKIKTSIETETGNNTKVIHHVNTIPIFGRSLRNEIYNSVNVKNDDYIEVDGDNVENSYIRANNYTQSTDF
jgi:hypothetical protein